MRASWEGRVVVRVRMRVLIRVNRAGRLSGVGRVSRMRFYVRENPRLIP